jgi:hypothetical protein
MSKHTKVSCWQCRRIIALLPGRWRLVRRPEPGEPVSAGNVAQWCTDCGCKMELAPIREEAAA